MAWQPDELEALDRSTIAGHPKLELDPAPTREAVWRPWGVRWKERTPEPVVVYLCANCERLRTVLFLTKDRWLCTACRNEGDAQPTFVPINRPNN